LPIDNLHVPLSIGNSKVASMTEDDLDLVGAAEVAEMLGVSKQRVNQMATSRGGFVRPVAVLKAGRIWRRQDIVQWAKANRRKPRRSSASPQ
jgi:hypothetical protein